MSASIAISKAQYQGDPGIFGSIFGGIKRGVKAGLGVASVLPGIGGFAGAARNILFPGDARINIPGASTLPPLPRGVPIGSAGIAMPGTGFGGGRPRRPYDGACRPLPPRTITPRDQPSRIRGARNGLPVARDLGRPTDLDRRITNGARFPSDNGDVGRKADRLARVSLEQKQLLLDVGGIRSSRDASREKSAAKSLQPSGGIASAIPREIGEALRGVDLSRVDTQTIKTLIAQVPRIREVTPIPAPPVQRFIARAPRPVVVERADAPIIIVPPRPVVVPTPTSRQRAPRPRPRAPTPPPAPPRRTMGGIAELMGMI